MQLTQHTDYALRVLIYLTRVSDRWVTVDELAVFFRLSKNHLVKIVHKLGLKGYVQTQRGKGGGIRLARSAGEIYIGDVVRSVEGHFYIAECFNPLKQGQCAVQPTCGLTGLFSKATRHFMQVLDEANLEQMALSSQNLESEPRRTAQELTAGEKH